jgi:N-acetylmuramoyl-L-alanine amidase
VTLVPFTAHVSTGADTIRYRCCLTAVVVMLCLAAGPGRPAASPAPPARAMFERAVTLDQAVRAAMSDHASSQPPTLAQFRTAMSAYQAVVWQHPTSGFCDNALWQASLLAIEAFDRFGQEHDRLAAIRFLGMLVREYPTSGFVRRAHTALARAENLRSAAAAAPAPVADAASPKPPRLVTIQNVQRTASAEATQVVIQLDGLVAFREERIDNPARVFFDLAGTQPSEAVKDAIMTFESGLVKQLRVGRHPNSVTRIVIDADGVDHHHAEVLDAPPRLVITCWPAAAAVLPSSSATVPSPLSAPFILPSAAGTDSAQPQPLPAAGPEPPAAPPPEPIAADRPVVRVVTTASASHPAAETRVAKPDPSMTPATPSSNLQGGYSLARQLGLGASRIVIDAGHGGHDPGAMFGRNAEAAITLDIALRLEKLLLKQPGIEVVLTRRTDVFVPLQERTELANREGADLFVSIHVNASENRSARGVETYLLDFASSPDDEAIAARENAASMMTMSHLNDLVKQIALTTKADESRDLAVQVQQSLVHRLRPFNGSLRDLGVKRAPFVVLIGASMPSVLVEVAFLTHRQEGRLIAGPTYRQRVADSIADGIRRYQQTLKKASPVASGVVPAPALGLPGRDQIQ